MDVWVDPNALGEQIRVARRRAGWSQQQLAEEAGTSRSKVARWEAGDTASLGASENARRAVAILVGHLTDQMHVLGLVPEPTDLAGRVQVLEDELAKLHGRIHDKDLEVGDDPPPADDGVLSGEDAPEIDRLERELAQEDDDDEELPDTGEQSA